MVRRQQSGVNINARFSVRDFLLLVSMLLGSGNLFWCFQHGKEIEKLKNPNTQTEIKPHVRNLPETAFSTGAGIRAN